MPDSWTHDELASDPDLDRLAALRKLGETADAVTGCTGHDHGIFDTGHVIVPGRLDIGLELIQGGDPVRLTVPERKVIRTLSTQLARRTSGIRPADRDIVLHLVERGVIAYLATEEELAYRRDLMVIAHGRHTWSPLAKLARAAGVQIHAFRGPTGRAYLHDAALDWWEHARIEPGLSNTDMLAGMYEMACEDEDTFTWVAEQYLHRTDHDATFDEFTISYLASGMPVTLFDRRLGGVFRLDYAGETRGIPVRDEIDQKAERIRALRKNEARRNLRRVFGLDDGPSDPLWHGW